MRSINELTEELYQDADLRKEFEKFVQLRTQYKALEKQVDQHVNAHLPPVLNYTDITTAIYRRHWELCKVKGLPEGLFFLSRSLVKTIVQRYNLPIGQASQLAYSVVDKYEQEPKR